MSKIQCYYCQRSFTIRERRLTKGPGYFRCEECKEVARSRRMVTSQCDMCGRAHKVNVTPGSTSRATTNFTCDECAEVKRQRERDKGKRIKVEIRPQRVTIKSTGYQPEELGKAVSSMSRSQAFAAAIDKPDQKKKAIAYKRHYDD